MAYDLLDPRDEEKEKQYCDLLNEITKLQSKTLSLRKIAERNRALESAVWRMKTGAFILIRDMANDHLLNAIRQQVRREGEASTPELVDEAKSRGLDIELDYVSDEYYD